MKRSEQKVYRLTAPQWRALAELAKAHPRPRSIPTTSATTLLKRELVVREPRTENQYLLTDLGQRVYGRLSVGLFCKSCGRPVTFETRTCVPNESPAKWWCTECARRNA